MKLPPKPKAPYWSIDQNPPVFMYQLSNHELDAWGRACAKAALEAAARECEVIARHDYELFSLSGNKHRDSVVKGNRCDDCATTIRNIKIEE